MQGQVGSILPCKLGWRLATSGAFRAEELVLGSNEKAWFLNQASEGYARGGAAEQGGRVSLPMEYCKRHYVVS